MQSIGGILKRPETKRHGINVWELPEPNMVMRRYKREVNVLNPDTGRVYTMSLHHCVAGEAFQQLEIEYDGRLVPGSVTEMARFRDTHRPEHLLTIAARADAAGWSHLGDAVRQRYLDLTQGASDAEIVATSMTHKAAKPLEGEHLERVESEVIDDMRLLRSALVRNGLKPSTVTKRKWLRKLYAELED